MLVGSHNIIIIIISARRHIEDLHADSNFRRIILYAAILGVWCKSRGIMHVCFPTRPIITLKYTA